MMTPTGDINDMTIPWLFQDLRIAQNTGTVVFEHDEIAKKVYFKQGDIIYASSNVADERLGEFLLRTEKITHAQFDRSSEIVTKTGKKLGAVLFELGILTSHELVAQVNLQVKDIILRTFSWRYGRYQFQDGFLPLAEIVPLQISTGDLIIEGVKNIDWKVIRKALPPLKTIIRPAADPSLLFQSAQLDQDHRSVLSIIDGKKSIEEICYRSGLGDFNTLKAIYVLLSIRMTEQGEIKTEEERDFVHDVVRQRVGASERKASEPTASNAPAVTKETIMRAYENLGRQNYFEMLNVGRSATTQEIKKAYFQFAKLYHPDRHFEPEMSDMKEVLESLFTHIHDAYEALNSDAKRDQYNLSLSAGKAPHRKAGHPSVAPDSAKKGSAIAQFNEGLKCYRLKNFWGAEEAFRWALRLDPTNPDYVFHEGLALAQMPRRLHDAEEFFKRAVKMAPSRIDYYLELGNFYVKNGLRTKARSTFEEALQHDPNSIQIKQALKNVEG